jgi:hypothetical protein
VKFLLKSADHSIGISERERRSFLMGCMADLSTERLGGASSISDALGRQPDPRDQAKQQNKRVVPHENANSVSNATPDAEEPNHQLDELA